MRTASFKSNFFKQVLTAGGYTYFVHFLSFFSTMILARLLSPAEYGIVALITVFTSFISLFVDTGYGPLVIRSDYGSLFHRSLHTLTISLGFILFAIALLLAFPISKFYENNSLVLPFITVALSIIISSFGIVPTALINKERRFDWLSKIRLAEGAFRILSTILLAYLGWSYWAIIVGSVLTSLLKTIIVNRLIKVPIFFGSIKYPLAAMRLGKSMILNITGVKVLSYWSKKADNLLVGKIFGTASLGIYDRAYSLLTLFTGILSGIFSWVLFPALKEIGNDNEKLKKEFSDIINIMSMVTLPISLIMIFLPNTIVDILWGSQWHKVAEYLPFFGILLLLQNLMTFLGDVFLLKQMEYIYFRIHILSSFLMISCFIIGAQYSMKFMIMLYSITYITTIVPISVYYGYHKALHIELNKILKLWTDKIALTLIMCISAYYDYLMLMGFSAILFTLLTLFKCKNIIISIIQYAFKYKSKLALKN